MQDTLQYIYDSEENNLKIIIFFNYFIENGVTRRIKRCYKRMELY